MKRTEEIKDEIKIIGNRATWLLGILIGTLLALGGFLSQDFGAEKDTLTQLLKIIVGGLFYIYLGATVIYMGSLMKINFKKFDSNTSEAELQEILKQLTNDFNALVSLFILPLLACFALATVFVAVYIIALL